MSRELLIQVNTRGTETTVSFESDHINEFRTAQRISDDFCELVENGICRSHPIDQINLDFAEISRISSAGLNGLIQMNSKSRSHGVRLVMVNVPETVLEVFKLTRLERMFDFGSPSGDPVVSTL